MIAYIISHLAKAWITTEWCRRSALCSSLPAVLETFNVIFQTATPGGEAAKVLVALKQGKRSALNYATEFCKLLSDQSALVDAFYNGLTKVIKDHLTPLDLPAK